MIQAMKNCLNLKRINRLKKNMIEVSRFQKFRENMITDNDEQSLWYKNNCKTKC